jgi:site-specific recombinase XerD
MAQQLIELVEQSCTYQRKQRGRTEGGEKTYRWNLEQFLVFVRAREGRLARITDLTTPAIQAWLDDMAAGDLGVNTLRCRLSTLSSFCGWMVKRGHLAGNRLSRSTDRHARRQCQPSRVPRSWTR